MIAKPRDWESAQAYTGESQQVTPGGHMVRILAMRQEMSQQSQKPMLVVAFDIDEGSELDGFYKRQHAARKVQNPGAKWNGVIRYMLYGKDGVSTNGFFKGFVTAVEESNPGYKWNWDERSMAGKRVGLVFREEEYRAQTGEVKSSVKAYQARSVQAIADGVPVPEKKRLAEAVPSVAPFNPAAGFTQVEDENLPF